MRQYKKAILNHVRVIKSEAWNERIQDGTSPTQSGIVNDVIKQVKTAEVRKLGIESATQCPLEAGEFD